MVLGGFCACVRRAHHLLTGDDVRGVHKPSPQASFKQAWRDGVRRSFSDEKWTSVFLFITKLMHLQVECMFLTCMDCRAHASWQPSLAARMAATRTALRRLRSSLAVDDFKTEACFTTAVRRACLWAKGARIARTRAAHGRLRD